MKVHKSLKPQKCTKCNDETWFSENGIKEHFVLMHHQAENATENSGGGNNASEKKLGCFVCKAFFVDSVFQKPEFDKHISEKHMEVDLG